MNIEKIELEGQEYPIAFPSAALAEFERVSNIHTFDFLTMLDTGMVPFTNLCQLVSAGLNAGARKTGSEARYTPEQAGDMFALYDAPKLAPILKKYMNISTSDAEKNEQGAALTATTTTPAEA